MESFLKEAPGSIFVSLFIGIGGPWITYFKGGLGCRSSQLCGAYRAQRISFIGPSDFPLLSFHSHHPPPPLGPAYPSRITPDLRSAFRGGNWGGILVVFRRCLKRHLGAVLTSRLTRLQLVQPYKGVAQGPPKGALAKYRLQTPSLTAQACP